MSYCRAKCIAYYYYYFKEVLRLLKSTKKFTHFHFLCRDNGGHQRRGSPGARLPGVRRVDQERDGAALLPHLPLQTLRLQENCGTLFFKRHSNSKVKLVFLSLPLLEVTLGNYLKIRVPVGQEKVCITVCFFL